MARTGPTRVAAFGRKLRLAYDAYVTNGILAPGNRHGWLFYWARFVLQRRRPFIIGITGSAGKSTATAYAAAVLRAPGVTALVGRVRWTRENMNNWDGLPLVILGLPRWHDTVLGQVLLMLLAPLQAVRNVIGRYPDVLILEYGSDRGGYLQRMVDLAPPRLAVITTVGPAHLQGMEDVAGVLTEKLAIASGAPAPELVIAGEEHEHIAALERRLPCPVIRVRGRGVELAANIAREIGRYFGIPEEAVAAGLAHARPPEGRLSRWRTAALEVIDDSYNANPLSMRLALDLLASVPERGRRVAILGTMAELGHESPRYHREIGAYARGCADLVVGVGDMAHDYAPDVHYPDSVACAAAVAELLRPGDAVLIKGSAAVDMRRIVDRIKYDKGVK